PHRLSQSHSRPRSPHPPSNNGLPGSSTIGGERADRSRRSSVPPAISAAVWSAVRLARSQQWALSLGRAAHLAKEAARTDSVKREAADGSPSTTRGPGERRAEPNTDLVRVLAAVAAGQSNTGPAQTAGPIGKAAPSAGSAVDRDEARWEHLER